MPCCGLLTAVKNYKKVLKTARLFLQDRDRDQDQMFKTKTKTFIFVLEAPRDQNPGLEDYITVSRFESRLPRCRVQPWESRLHTCAYVTNQYTLVPDNGR